MISKTAIAALIALTVSGLWASSASATYPGENGRIYFTANAIKDGFAVGIPDVWSVNPDGSGLLNLTDLPGGPGEGSDPSVSADGSKVAFATGSQATAEIWTMNADGSSPHRVTNDNLLDHQPAVSPDGSRIAFSSFRDYPTYVVRDIWTMGFNGAGAAALLNDSLQEFWPAFTPDGQTVVLSHETGGNNFDIATVAAAGGPFDSVANLTTGAPEEVNPSVAPDGTRVAFTSWPDGFPLGSRPDVMSVGIGGGPLQPIATDQSRQESFPTYSPDGQKIAYVSDLELIVANADGSNPAPIDVPADIAVFVTQPDWAVREAPPAETPADTDPPQTTITKHPRKRSTKRKAKLRFSSDEPNSTFECRFDRRAFKPCASPRKYKHLEFERHRFAVRAADAAGNVDPSPAKARFRVVPKP